MLTIFRSTKGGSGTSTVSAGFAGILGRRTKRHAPRAGRVLAVDLCGDLPAVLGIATPLIGLSEWLDRSSALDFDELCIDCGQGVHLVPTGSPSLPDPNSPGWNRLIAVLDDHLAHDGQVVIDAGTEALPRLFTTPALMTTTTKSSTRVLLVVRPCYLALRRAVEEITESRFSADGVVLVTGGGRVLTRRDVESVLGIPVVAEVPLDPDVGRRVDSGLFLSRLPASLVAALAPVVDGGGP
ncbi:MAG: hypothetical protein ACO3SP_00950 [Ilumatobacteraceae bacterium]